MDFVEWCKNNKPAGEHCFLDDVKELEGMGSYTEKAEEAAAYMESCLTDKGAVQVAMYAFLEERANNNAEIKEGDIEDLFVAPDAMTTYGNTMKLAQALTAEKVGGSSSFSVSRKKLIPISEWLNGLRESSNDRISRKVCCLESAIEGFSKYAFTIGNFTKIPKFPTEKKKEFEQKPRHHTLNQAKGLNGIKVEWFPGADPKELPEHTNDQFAAFLMYFKHDKEYETWKNIAMLGKKAEAEYEKAGIIYKKMMDGSMFGKDMWGERIRKVTKYLLSVSKAIKLHGEEIVKAVQQG